MSRRAPAAVPQLSAVLCYDSGSRRQSIIILLDRTGRALVDGLSASVPVQLRRPLPQPQPPPSSRKATVAVSSSRPNAEDSHDRRVSTE